MVDKGDWLFGLKEKDCGETEEVELLERCAEDELDRIVGGQDGLGRKGTLANCLDKYGATKHATGCRTVACNEITEEAVDNHKGADSHNWRGRADQCLEPGQINIH